MQVDQPDVALRIERLERENRQLKRLGAGLLSLAIVIVLGSERSAARRNRSSESWVGAGSDCPRMRLLP